jgi:hypothetical protein
MVHTRTFPVAIVLLSLGLIILGFVVSRDEVGVGSFRQAEFRVTIVDKTGKPYLNAEMRVVDALEKDFPCYPVTDYYGPNSLRNNESGTFVFHHVERGAEYTTTNRRSLLGFVLSESGPPNYYCVFLSSDGKEFARRRFGDYFGVSGYTTDAWNRLPVSTTVIGRKNSSCSNLPAHLQPEVSSYNQPLRFPLVECTVQSNE